MSKEIKKRIKKENLPSKLCIMCKRPFTWRKKWAKNWDTVLYCSKACSAEYRSVRSRSRIK